MLAIAILAAGKGTRLRSSLPKVLQSLSGITLIERVLSSCENIEADRNFVVVGHQGEEVKKSLHNRPELEFVIQQPQNGTGHAVQQLLPLLKNFSGDLLVLNGDVPLLKPSTIELLIKNHRISNAGVTLLTSKVSNPNGYGRVFVNSDGQVSKIVEDKDCTQSERENNLINAGIYCFNWNELTKILSNLSNNNLQKEIYLTDAISKLSKAMHVEVDNSNELSGINNKKQLAQCEGFIQTKLRDYWMKEGVTFIDPGSCTLSENCQFGKDVIIEPQTHFRGKCRIGNDCKIGPGTLLENTDLGCNVRVVYSVVKESMIEDNTTVGPFANLRPGAEVASGCRIGNFVEIKKSIIGEGTNISHLSYIGDAEIGRQVNIGAGSITANFDGKKKNKTIIGNNSKTGANTVLIAPITLGSNVTVGAGSTLTKDVPSGALAIERAKQISKENWISRKKA